MVAVCVAELSGRSMTAEQEKWIAHRVLREVRDGISHPGYLVDWALRTTGDLD